MSSTSMLIDGVPLVIRPIRADDSAALRAMHRGFTERTIYQRFLGLHPDLSPTEADYFTHVDGVGRFALVAEDPAGALVAVARYDRLPPDWRSAEVAFVVADAYQHHGLGTALVSMLREHAREAGVQCFVADVLTTNLAMQHAFNDAGLCASSTRDHGVAHLEMPIL
ncbi:MAG: GNAT family N-acetyltransferase [Frankiaceae bacterium]|nr:GNAT family N-acetyltransferase [Frankiaceae bacterium]